MHSIFTISQCEIRVNHSLWFDETVADIVNLAEPLPALQIALEIK